MIIEKISSVYKGIPTIWGKKQLLSTVSDTQQMLMTVAFICVSIKASSVSSDGSLHLYRLGLINFQDVCLSFPLPAQERSFHICCFLLVTDHKMLILKVIRLNSCRKQTFTNLESLQNSH